VIAQRQTAVRADLSADVLAESDVDTHEICCCAPCAARASLVYGRLRLCLSEMAMEPERHLERKCRGFYPTTFALGIAFQQIQLFVAPDAAHAIAERLKEQAEDDDEGGPESPARHLDRQLRRIRKGERLEALTTLLPDRD
jgi:hypothetical protein